ncbi:MAG: AAA family ATPase [Anaerolineae bacterium]|nr:AAA family ATPase [Anaerolineae bacterium]
MVSAKQSARYEGLSQRSSEILRLLADGLSDREIADHLSMSINTVKWYNRQIYDVLGVSSRTQAAARARDFQPADQNRSAAPSAPSPLHNLPAETTRFIGRRHALEVIKQQMQTARLLTLVGTPGTGKTRLALQAAQEVAVQFRDGAFFVPLASLSEAGQVAPSIISAVGVNASPTRTPLETLKQALREKHLLLILDNFEHLLAAAPQISELLAAAPRLAVLATSREPLHLYGEQEYAVPPLELPLLENVDPQSLQACEATVLFMQRARAVKADFAITNENALAVARICIRLEGLPLAIELAAARIKLLTPQALLARLDSRLDALTGSLRDLPPRQQTLRSTIEWSYNLLSEQEKQLFARLAVFRGGRSLDAIEAVCGPGLQMDALEAVESLIHKSLLMQQPGADDEPRFVMLETLHEYAWERLHAGGEAALLRQRHADYFAALAERAESELRRAGSGQWMRVLNMEHQNLLLALEYAFLDDHKELGLRLIAALRDFWAMSGRLPEGAAWTTRGLSAVSAVPLALRARIYTAAGFLFSVSLDRSQAGVMMERAVASAREAGSPLVYAWALLFQGGAAIGESQTYRRAVPVVEEALALFQNMDCKPGLAQGFCILGELHRAVGDDERAKPAYEQGLALSRQIGDQRHESMILGNLGFIATHRGEMDAAHQLFRESLLKSLELAYDHHLNVANLVPLAGTLAARGQPERAVKLYGAAEALLQMMGVGLQVGDQPEYERNLALVRGNLDAAVFQAAWAEGRAMTLDQALTLALVDDPS